MKRTLPPWMRAGLACLCCAQASAETTVFFEPFQAARLVESGDTWDTIQSHGYLFTCTRDKLFTGGVGLTEPIGRPVRVPWPAGVEAQAVTTGPNLSKARITVQRADGEPFDLTSFRAMLLANTAGAGGSIEIMPVLDGEDAWNDPLPFNATGFAGLTFYYDTSPSYLGCTEKLKGFHMYKIALYVDFALVDLTLHSTVVPGDVDGDRDVDSDDLFAFQACASGPAVPLSSGCEFKDLDFDNDVDQEDFGIVQRCYGGADLPGDPDCGG